MPEDQPSVWRLVALVFVAIAVLVYVFATIRAQRRKDKNPPSDDSYTIPIGKIEFPELNHLPASDRERILRSSVEDPDVRSFLDRMRRFANIMFYATIAICIAIAITLDTPVWLLTICTVATFFTLLIIRIRIGAKVLRRAVRRNLDASQSDSLSRPANGMNP
jgi:hypothetical protein